VSRPVPPQPERIEFLGFAVAFLHAEPGGALSMLEWDAPAGAGGIPLHVHEHTTEGFYVLRGRLALQLDDDRLDLDALRARLAERHDITVVGPPPDRQRS
jgi:mannose-6-phosphate isomerase-like protein (cupin superfamily)